jgi:hypothetical protein
MGDNDDGTNALPTTPPDEPSTPASPQPEQSPRADPSLPKQRLSALNDASGGTSSQGSAQEDDPSPSEDSGDEDLPDDVVLGEPPRVLLGAAQACLARFATSPIVILHGRFPGHEVARQVASWTKGQGTRWICRLDSGSETTSRLRHTDPDAIGKQILSIDTRRGVDAKVLALWVAYLNYEDLDYRSAWQELLLTTNRSHLSRVLSETNSRLLVSFTIPRQEVDPSRRLIPDLSLEVSWSELLIDQLRVHGRGMCLTDDDARKLQNTIDAYREKNPVLDKDFFGGIEDMAEWPMAPDELQTELDKRLSQLVADRAGRATDADQPSTPERYDERHAIDEIMVVVLCFLGRISRRAFDRLVGALLPDDPIPQDLIPPHRKRVGYDVPQTVCARPARIRGALSASTTPASPLTWCESWNADADYYRKKRDVLVNPEMQIQLGKMWLPEDQRQKLLQSRPARVESIYERLRDRGLIFSRDEDVADAASKLLASLIGRLGLVHRGGGIDKVYVEKDRVISILDKSITVALQGLPLPEAPDEESDAGVYPFISSIVNSLSRLLEDLSDTLGSVFPSVLYDGLRDYARRAVRQPADPKRCYLLTSLCLFSRDVPPRWKVGQDFGEIVRYMVGASSAESRSAIESALAAQYRRARTSAQRIAFLTPLRAWLPAKVGHEALAPAEAMALRLWLDCLAQDCSGTPRAVTRSAAPRTAWPR